MNIVFFFVSIYRNESGLVIEFKVIFSQDVHMGEMNRLYFALYEAKHLDAILVRPISDTGTLFQSVSFSTRLARSHNNTVLYPHE